MPGTGTRKAAQFALASQAASPILLDGFKADFLKTGFKMKLNKKWILGGVTVLFAITIFFLSEPFKVTDPADPRFDPQNFSLQSYKNEGELLNAIQTLFPVGSGRVDIESLLVNVAGAKVKDVYKPTAEIKIAEHPDHFKKGHYYVTYTDKGQNPDHLDSKSVRILFDGSNDKALAIAVKFFNPKMPNLWFPDINPEFVSNPLLNEEGEK